MLINMAVSLKSKQSTLVDSKVQLLQLNTQTPRVAELEKFGDKLKPLSLFPLKPLKLEIFQVNVGKMCNQVCKHCHVDAGPDRREIMTKETMSQVLTAVQACGAHTVDLTGGAPEMNPHFRWFVEELSKMNRKVIVRCNLTIILANKSYQDLPQFFAKHKVHVVSSLPFFEQGKTDKQRGDGVFDKSIKALKMLNEVGYGKPGSNLILDLVYNPSGAFLPGAQGALEAQFKKELMDKFGISFNQLYAITNMPISRFLEYLMETGNLEEYMEKLVSAFNPTAAAGVMCRNTVSVSWDGFLFDCDFNQMLDLTVKSPSKHVSEFSENKLAERDIVINQHCYGCTAGAGSSCGGTVTN
jgi:radical SAM/Cys-rich protein